MFKSNEDMESLVKLRKYSEWFIILVGIAVLALLGVMVAESSETMPQSNLSQNTFINKHPAGIQTEVMNLYFVYDQTLVVQGSSSTIKPNAITPDFPPSYVAIGGDAINPNCKDPYNVACHIDISANCSLGVCNVAIAVPVGTWRTIWYFYAGQAHVFMMSLNSTKSTPNRTWLSSYMMIDGDTLPVTNPFHRTWRGACVRVDRTTPTTIEVNRNIALQTNCQEITTAHDISVKDEDLVPYTGSDSHDGQIKLRTYVWLDSHELINAIFQAERQKYFESLLFPDRAILPPGKIRFF
jgi:hypothetical protein